MATNSTPNFGLNQWEADDPVLREDFNADNQKLDTTLSLLGNCQIAAGTYVGNGQFGEGTSCRLELGFKPLVLFMHTASGKDNNHHIVWFNNGINPTHTKTTYVKYFVSWDDTGLSWYMTANSSSYQNADTQFNSEGQTYHYVAFGCKF